jgi:fission process protein 1
MEASVPDLKQIQDKVKQIQDDEHTKEVARYSAYGRFGVMLLRAKQYSRFLAYTSDVGEAARPIVNKKVVYAAYGMSGAYCFGAVGYKGYTAKNEGKQGAELADIIGQETVFQLVASLLLPGIIIHTGVHQTQKLLKARQARPFLQSWAPSLVGLGLIPAMPLVDHPCEMLLEKGFHELHPYYYPKLKDIFGKSKSA